MGAVRRFRKNPVEVEMMLWDGTEETFAAILAWTGGCFRRAGQADTAETYDRLHDTWVKTSVGQYVAKGPYGEHYAIAPEVVETTYTEITGGVAYS